MTDEKREMRKTLRKWKQEKGEKEIYIQRRQGYKRLCKTKEDRQQEKIGEEIKQVKNINQLREYIINREWKRRIRTNKGQLNEWRDYFMELLGKEEYPRQTKEEKREISM